jgi:ferric-dicitrate binding protein FerR (iron transport regulator)
MDQMYARSTAVSRRALLGAAAACLAPIPALDAATAAGLVETMVGQGFAESAAVRRDLLPRSNIFVGDLVGTGTQSRLTLRLGVATQLKLGAEARIRIDQFIANAGGVLELQGGTMLFDGAAQTGRNISVRSPFALIAVRGTRFFAGPSNDVFGVFAARGRVRVTAAGRSVVLAQGMGTNIAYPGAPPTDPAKWGESRIQRALASVQ